MDLSNISPSIVLKLRVRGCDCSWFGFVWASLTNTLRASLHGEGPTQHTLGKNHKRPYRILTKDSEA